jgi:hypothetical protein
MLAGASCIGCNGIDDKSATMKTLATILFALMFVGRVFADAPASQPDQITYDTLLATIKGGASMQQLAVMQNFAIQKDAPAALPDLLSLLKQNDSRLDNNVCLAVTFIAMAHPDADCPLDELLETVQRHQWTSQQKAAQALRAALKPSN